MPTKKEKQTFEERLGALEELVNRMEAGGMTLADTLKAYESGVKLSESLKKDLTAAQERLDHPGAATSLRKARRKHEL